MNPYVTEMVPSDILLLFRRIRDVVNEMPDVDLGGITENRKIRVSCHMLVRALATCFPVEVKDGHFLGIWEHSWLVTEGGFTIDPYPVAMFGGPVLLDTATFSPWRRDGVYEEGLLSRLDEDPRFPEHVAKVTAAVRETAERLGYI